MSQPSVICIVEDEPDLAALLNDYLTASGYRTELFHTGDSAEAWLTANEPALILLDLMLPGIDGLQLCRNQHRRCATPIIMMTAKVEEIDRLLGLELGADDYICKPFSPREVVARVKAVLRRSQKGISPISASDSLGAPPELTAPVTLDEQGLRVTVFGETVELTEIEFRLFSLLFSHPGRIFSRQHILDRIYQDYRVVGDRTVDSHIKKLRRKLLTGPERPELIRSVYGSGYRYEAP